MYGEAVVRTVGCCCCCCCFFGGFTGAVDDGFVGFYGLEVVVVCVW